MPRNIYDIVELWDTAYNTYTSDFGDVYSYDEMLREVGALVNDEFTYGEIYNIVHTKILGITDYLDEDYEK